jgi:hypothetical protein
MLVEIVQRFFYTWTTPTICSRNCLTLSCHIKSCWPQYYTVRTQIGMFRSIRMDHTNCLQVSIKTLHSILRTHAGRMPADFMPSALIVRRGVHVCCNT